MDIENAHDARAAQSPDRRKEDGPDRRHRPDGLDPATVRALGDLSKALETTERARGHLYAFHQLTGGADLTLGDAVAGLREAGHLHEADLLERELLGRNVLPGRWTFQVVEEYDDGYYQTFRDLEQEVRQRLADGRRHLYEAAMKEDRRSHGHPAHTAVPDGSPPRPSAGDGDTTRRQEPD